MIINLELGLGNGFATKAKFVRQKTYLEEIDGEMKITCAGGSSNVFNNALNAP